jgi:hypothetical protein
VWTWVLVVAIVGALAATVTTVAGRWTVAAAGIVASAGSVAGGAAGIWVTSATATLAADSADEARLGWRILWFVAGMAWGLLVRAAAGRAMGIVTPAGTEPPGDGLRLAPGERAAWTTTLRSPLILAVFAAATGAVTVVAATMVPGAWPAIALPVLAGLLFGEVRVSVDHRGLRLVAGLVGVPIKRIPLDDIASATTENIDPKQWGGWGYRVLPGRSALVLRSGPGLVLHLRDGRRFAVTVDDPKAPADLLAALRSRAHSS